MSTYQSKSTVTINITQRLAAIPKYNTAKSDFVIGGEHYELGALLAIFQAVLATQQKVDDARSVLTTALNARASAGSVYTEVDSALKAWITAKYGKDSQAMIDFGYAAKKRAAPSTETRYATLEKLRAPRKARHTMGRRQRQRIKGAAVDSTMTHAPAASSAPGSDGAPVPAPTGTTR